MKYLQEHNFLPSFYLWFENTLLNEGEAFTNISSPLYPTTGGGGFQFGSPYKQWVYDSSINGAQIPSGVYVNSNFVVRGGSGLYLDFLNGNVTFTTAPPSNETVSGNFSVKDFDIHIAQESEEEILFNTKYLPKQPINQSIQGKIIENHQKIYPLVFLKYNAGQNDTYQLGQANGQITSNIRAIILADNGYLFDGITSLFRDKKNTCFYLLNPEEFPFNGYNDLKSGSYNYDTMVSNISNKTSKIVHVSNVSISKFPENINAEIGPNLIAGIIDFDLLSYR